MTDRPIIFSAPMVRALLAGQKTQTRRLATSPLRRVAPGDRLYVREHWRTSASLDHLSPSAIGAAALEAGYIRPWAPMLFVADMPEVDRLRGHADEPVGKHRQGMHMPRWASRLTLIVEAVRIEPLHAISSDDAVAEGVERVGGGVLRWENWSGAEGQSATSPRAAYGLLWNSLHNKPNERWDDNPDVVALTFRVERANIDTLSPPSATETGR